MLTHGLARVRCASCGDDGVFVRGDDGAVSFARLPPPTDEEGFSLQADVHLHAHDRPGLEQLCRYGARGAIALSRLSEPSDGRYAYRMKRPLPDGRAQLVLDGVGLLRKLVRCTAALASERSSRPSVAAPLIAPPRFHLLRFHSGARSAMSGSAEAGVIAPACEGSRRSGPRSPSGTGPPAKARLTCLCPNPRVDPTARPVVAGGAWEPCV